VTNPFYSSGQTELFRAVLHDIIDAVPEAILFDRWGTSLRTGGPMSHDIDPIIEHTQLAVLQGLVDDLSVSRHLADTK